MSDFGVRKAINGAVRSAAQGPTRKAPAPAATRAPAATKAQTRGGMFGASFNDADPSQSSVWLEPGNHRLQVLAIKPHQGNKGGRKTSAVIVEYQILESDTMRPGLQTAHYFDALHARFEGDFKAFAMALLNCEASEVDADRCNSLLSDESADDHPAAGMTVFANVRAVPTKTGGVFNRVTYAADAVDGEPGHA